MVTLRDKPLGDNDSMPLVQVRCRIRCSQNRIYGSGSIVSGLFNQYLSLLFKVQQTMSGYNPHCCSNDTLLCCVDWDCGSGSDNLVVFFIPKLRYSIKVQLLISNFISCRVPNRTCAGTGPLLTSSGSGSCYFFLTGSGSSFTYKKVPKNSKKMFLPSYLYTGSGSGTDRKVPALAGSGSAPLLTETGFSVTGTVCTFQSHRQRTLTADPVPTTWFFLSQDFVIL